MTLYDEPELLLLRAAEVVGRHAEAPGDTDASQELADAARLLRRIAAIWMGMFAALECEIGVLSDSIATVREAADREGVVDAGLPVPPSGGDPLARYQEALLALDSWSRYLRARSEPWCREALGTVRRAIATSAEIQGVIVDRALATR